MSTPPSPIDSDLQTFAYLLEATNAPLGRTPSPHLRPPTPFAQTHQHAPFTDLFPPAAPSPPDTPRTTATSSSITDVLPTCPICLDSPIKMIYPCRHTTCLRCALEIWYTGVTKENAVPRDFSCPMCRGLVHRMGVVLGIWGSDEEGGEEVVGIEGVKVSVGGWKSIHWWVGRNCDFLEAIEEGEEQEGGEGMQG
ncbi:hypothetical protein C7212DRAFT_362761 [Tuber magnatum]|uniref:RING-type domain-containing protein n=1 Tax=Tuber magnatum TaxID=42249 RepID=A0A317ST59_9PEZI|nr:hypothetical protein C7212DRAFT_362761 [Tuber magnatum]